MIAALGTDNTALATALGRRLLACANPTGSIRIWSALPNWTAPNERRRQPVRRPSSFQMHPLPTSRSGARHPGPKSLREVETHAGQPAPQDSGGADAERRIAKAQNVEAQFVRNGAESAPSSELVIRRRAVAADDRTSMLGSWSLPCSAWIPCAAAGPIWPKARAAFSRTNHQ